MLHMHDKQCACMHLMISIRLTITELIYIVTVTGSLTLIHACMITSYIHPYHCSVFVNKGHLCFLGIPKKVNSKCACESIA